MKHSILKLILSITALIAVNGLVAQPTHPHNKSELPDHPRMFFTANAGKALKHKIGQEALLMQTHELILSECRSLLREDLLSRNQVGRRILHTSREALRRVTFLSYGYRMTGKVAFADRAVAELLNVSSFNDWNPGHFLDVAEMTLALAVGYDWLYPHLTNENKKKIKEAILSKGLQPSYLSEHNSWLSKKNNWNQVCNGGLVGGALAIFSDSQEVSRAIIDRAVQSVPLSMGEYALNGGYPEGPHYWAYGTTYNLLLIDLLEHNFGTDYGLSKLPGFLNTAKHMQHLEGLFLETANGAIPKYFNFGDNREHTVVEPAMFWFASKLNQPELLFSEVRKLKYFLQKNPQQLVKERFLPLLLVWSPAIPFSSIQAPEERFFVANGMTEVAMMRTSWENSDGIYVGVKGGTPSASHQHMDIGSFVMEANGIRWASDFGLQEYHSLESKGIDLWNRSQNSQRWTVFRYKNTSHNTLTINGKQQLVDGNAIIEKVADTNSKMAVSVHMTPLYSNDVNKLIRTIAIVDQQKVTIDDLIQNNNQWASVRWNMLTTADARVVDSKTILLTQEGKQLRMTISGAPEAVAYIETTASPNDFDAGNEGTTFVGFNFTVPSNTTQNIQVQLIPITQAQK